MAQHKEVFDLDLHEHTRVNLGPNPAMQEFGFPEKDWIVTVVRVPNGWIYIGLTDTDVPVFVPEKSFTLKG